MNTNEYDYNPTSHWDLDRFKYNNSIKEMSESQHRAVSMLTYYRRNFIHNMDSFETEHTISRKIYTGFFLNSLPIMLRSSNLPELNLKNRFIGTPDSNGIVEDVDGYLRYIDRKFGTWYAPCAA